MVSLTVYWGFALPVPQFQELSHEGKAPTTFEQESSASSSKSLKETIIDGLSSICLHYLTASSKKVGTYIVSVAMQVKS